jgi:hypothetical protein
VWLNPPPPLGRPRHSPTKTWHALAPCALPLLTHCALPLPTPPHAPSQHMLPAPIFEEHDAYREMSAETCPCAIRGSCVGGSDDVPCTLDHGRVPDSHSIRPRVCSNPFRPLEKAPERGPSPPRFCSSTHCRIVKGTGGGSDLHMLACLLPLPTPVPFPLRHLCRISAASCGGV